MSSGAMNGIGDPMPIRKRRNMGSGIGVYVPPAKLQAMRAAAAENGNDAIVQGGNDEPSRVHDNMKQKETWDQLKKTINGSINRLNLSNIRDITMKLFQDANLVRGRGLLARSMLKATLASPSFAHVYAALIAVISAKLPENGELVLSRAILAFQRAYKRRDKAAALSLVKLIAHLVNQSVAHELLALQILTVLLEDPTDDSVEVAVAFTLEVGQFLEEVSPKGMHAIMERFRAILHQGEIDQRVQYTIENLFAIRKGSFAQYPAIVPALDLVEREEQITFEIDLDSDIAKQELLDVYRFDEKYTEGEQLWSKIRAEILGESDEGSSSEGDDDASTASEDSNDEGDEHKQDTALTVVNDKATTVIHDLSEKDLIHLRRTIYLTIMSAATFEECTHKLAKIQIPETKEHELINMIIECCSQERTFLRYYGLISQRFCLLHQRWREAFITAFREQYMTVHRLETNKLRNVAKLFAHMLHTDALSWSETLSIIHLNEEETTSSSRIFIKILVQEMAEAIGMVKLKNRLLEQDLQNDINGLFPKDVDKPRDTRYAINFFTSIGLGPLTDDLREFLKNAPKLIMAQAEAAREKLKDEESVNSSSDSSSSSTSSSSYSSSTSSSTSSYSSRSRSRSRSRRRKNNRRRHRSRSSSSGSSSSFGSRSSGSISSSNGRGRSPTNSKERVRHRRRRSSSSSSMRSQISQSKRRKSNQRSSSASSSPRYKRYSRSESPTDRRQMNPRNQNESRTPIREETRSRAQYGINERRNERDSFDTGGSWNYRSHNDGNQAVDQYGRAIRKPQSGAKSRDHPRDNEKRDRSSDHSRSNSVEENYYRPSKRTLRDAKNM